MVISDLSYESGDGSTGSALHHWDNVNTVGGAVCIFFYVGKVHVCDGIVHEYTYI